MYSYKTGYSQEELYVPKGQDVVLGTAIGIISPDGWWYPMIPGDVNNATTFNFPVSYKRVHVEGGSMSKLISTERDPIFLEQTIEAGKELVEKDGCRAIVGCCGYHALYQTEVAAALNVPTFLSSLMQIPVILHALNPRQKVGIICADGPVLSSGPTLKEAGVDDLSRVVIAGIENLPEMRNMLPGTGHLNPGKLEKEVVALVKQTVNEHSDIGAILLECSALPPYAWAIQDAVRLPVFDFVTMINWVYSALIRRPFSGYM